MLSEINIPLAARAGTAADAIRVVTTAHRQIICRRRIPVAGHTSFFLVIYSPWDELHKNLSDGTKIPAPRDPRNGAASGPIRRVDDILVLLREKRNKLRQFGQQENFRANFSGFEKKFQLGRLKLRVTSV